MIEATVNILAVIGTAAFASVMVCIGVTLGDAALIVGPERRS